jgi:hypothetical protein
MTPAIHEILEELTDYDKTFRAKKHLTKADGTMEFSDLSNLIGWLLQWQKMIVHFPGLDDDFTNNAFLLSDPLQRRFKRLFELCPALCEVFVYKTDRIEYNPALTQQDKDEILEFLDKNHTITMTLIAKGTRVRTHKYF